MVRHRQRLRPERRHSFFRPDGSNTSDVGTNCRAVFTYDLSGSRQTGRGSGGMRLVSSNGAGGEKAKDSAHLSQNSVWIRGATCLLDGTADGRCSAYAGKPVVCRWR